MYDIYFLLTILSIINLGKYEKTIEPWKDHLLFLTDTLVKINWLCFK